MEFLSNVLNHTYKVLETEEELSVLISHCKTTKRVSLDFETNGYPVNHPDFIITILGVSFQPGSSFIVPLGHKDSVFQDNWVAILKRFSREIVLNEDIDKYVFNALFEYRIFLKYDLRPRGRFLDVMLMKYLLNEERPNDLKSIVSYMLPDWAGYDLPNQPGAKASQEAKVNFWSHVELEELSEYCAIDCDSTLRLALHFENRLIDLDLYHYIRNFYSPLVKILSRTLLEGVLIDREYLTYTEAKFAKELEQMYKDVIAIPEVAEFQEAIIEERVQEYIEQLENEIDEDYLTQAQINNRLNKISQLKIGEPTTKKEAKLFEPLNLASPKQLIELLYESEYGLELPILERTETGNPSTAEDTLLKLKAHDTSGFINKLLEVRANSTLYTTFLKGILEDHLTEEDKIHPSYLLHGARTGRLSSRGPNMQNIPRVTTNNFIKPMFYAPKDHYFVEVDGSQFELRIAAEMSEDPIMVDIFTQGKNIHVGTAAKMFGEDYDLVNKARKDESHPRHEEMVKKHKAAKVLNFTIFYGAGPQTVGEFITKSTGDKVNKEGAIEFTEMWFDAFPETEQWIKKQHKKAVRQGYVENLFGRKRRLHIFKDKNNKERLKGQWNEALRNSVNSPIQGGASDVTQWISICIYEAMLEGDLPGYLRLVSTVHDSVEYYVHKEDIHLFMNKVKEIGKTLPGLGEYMGYEFQHVEIKLSGEMGLNWGRMHEYNPNLDYVKFYDEEWEKYNQEPYPHIRFT
jgi:DNA polymerase I